MCAIVDANVISQVFEANPPEAGIKILLWIENNDSGHLMVGGKLIEELDRVSRFQKWAMDAKFSGKIKFADEKQVKAREDYLRRESNYISNDPHIIALAQVSGPRLLYSNDRKLQQGFKNKELVDNPRGKVYSTNQGREAFSSSHWQLLSRRDLCHAKS